MTGGLPMDVIRVQKARQRRLARSHILSRRVDDAEKCADSVTSDNI